MFIVKLCLLIVTPLVCLLFYRLADDYRFNRFELIFVEAGAALIGVLSSKMLIESPKWYEMCVIIWCVSGIIIFILDAYKKRKITINNFYISLFVVAIGVVSYSILTYGQANIHSDIATSNLLIQAQLKYKTFFPKEWCYVNGDIWVIGPQTFVYPFYFLSNNQVFIRECGACLCMIIVAMTLIYYYKKELKSIGWTICFSVIFMFLYYSRDMNMYQAAYSFQIILTLLSLIWVVHIFIRNQYKKVEVVACCLLVVLMGMSGMRQVAEVFLPILGAFVLFCWIENRKNYKDNVFKILFMIIPMLVSLVIYKVMVGQLHVVMTDNNNTVFVGSISEVWQNFQVSLMDLFVNFGYEGGVSLFGISGIKNLLLVLFCLFFTIVFPVCLYRRYNEQTNEVKYLLLFSFVHNIEMLILAMFCGKCVTPRYLLTFEYMSIILSSYYVTKYWIKELPKKKLFTTMYVIAFMILSVVYFRDSSNWKEEYNQRRQFSYTLVEMGLDDYKGYASYWNAYKTELYSDMKLQMASIGNPISGVQLESLVKHTWLVDSERYNEENCGSYLMLEQWELESLVNKPEELFGKAEQVITVDEMIIYIWEYDIAEKAFYSAE